MLVELGSCVFHVYRLRAARVLVIGLGGLGAEVVKNIVLSGIKSIVLLDHVLVSQLLLQLIPTDSSLFSRQIIKPI